MQRLLQIFVLAAALDRACCARADAQEVLPLQITWGYTKAQAADYFVKLTAKDAAIAELNLIGGEGGDSLQTDIVRGRAGAGDVDGVTCVLRLAPRTVQSITNAHSIWKYLVQNTEPGAAQRLQADAAWRPDSRKLTVQLNEEGTRGFSLTVDQLLRQKTFWFPELDLFISTGETPVNWGQYQSALKSGNESRVLERVADKPEASYHDFMARWEDMGSVAYRNPHSVPPGHIVGLNWDSALYKFGVDRLAEVRNDHGKADVFHFRFAWGDGTNGWRGQKLADGLPIITTAFELNGIRYEIEQFAFPLLGPPSERRGDVAMVLLQKVALRDTTGKARPITVRMELDREQDGASISLREAPGGFLLTDDTTTWLGISGTSVEASLDSEGKKKKIAVKLELPAGGVREFVVKLPSPTVVSANRDAFVALDYSDCRAATVKFWNEYLAEGATFKVPDEAVNTLFRANLWHALRLPRRHGGSGPNVKIDLPYSNFAYDQKGTPWPVNQSVYVDYMLYDLRGYQAIAAEELGAIYRNNQEANGHVGGFANWGVYTPGMLYSVAQHYLLSEDRDSFEKLLPQTLRALDWCLAEIERANKASNPTPGLVFAPLNDLTHEARSWAFNQAYFVGGLDLLGRALDQIGHPRAAECQRAAAKMRVDIAREFGRASARAPAVQLADKTWSVFVPSDAQGSGRMFQVWYPTDVDVGPLHLLRLKALDATGPLATAMLNDGEDNLFLKQGGTINEPVYNMQGTAYLLRDEPKAAIRTFYSTMACAFSHTVFEPVEHRWAWGQYFGPPSTDGSWFELYRNMLIRETDDDSLLLCQATPRVWLEPGKTIEVQRAPTYYGPVTFKMAGKSEGITATIETPRRRTPTALLVRFREAEGKPIRSVTVNGKPWRDFDPTKEWVRISKPEELRYIITTKH